MTAKLPVYGIRQWEHTKKITVPGGTYLVNCKGHILSNLKIMFIDCKDRELQQAAVPKAVDYVWDDNDVFDFDFAGLPQDEDTPNIFQDPLVSFLDIPMVPSVPVDETKALSLQDKLPK